MNELACEQAKSFAAPKAHRTQFEVKLISVCRNSIKGKLQRLKPDWPDWISRRAQTLRSLFTAPAQPYRYSFALQCSGVRPEFRQKKRCDRHEAESNPGERPA